MRKSLIAAIVVALALLAACKPANQAPKPLAGISGSGSSYYIQSGTAAKGARALSDDGALYKVGTGGAVGVVSFVDTSGAAVDVAVDHAIALSDGRLVIGVTYNAVAEAYIANPATGGLVALSPIPDGWDLAREESGSLWYISGGSLYKADLATGSSSRYSKEGESLATESWIKPVPDGVVVVPPSSGTQVYIAGAGVAGVTDSLSLPDPATYNSIEGMDGIVYRVRISGADVMLSAFTESATGTFIGAEETTLCTLAWTPSTYAIRLSPRRQTHELVLGLDKGIIRIVATSSGLSYAATPMPSGLASATYFTALGTLATAGDTVAYIAYPDTTDATLYHVWSIESGTLIAKAMAPEAGAEITTDRNVSGLEAVGGLLFWQRNTGSGVETMVYDGSTVKVYASGAETITAVE